MPTHTNAGSALRRALNKELTAAGFAKHEWYFVRESHIRGVHEIVEVEARRFTEGESGTSLVGGIGVLPIGGSAGLATRNKIMLLEATLPPRAGDPPTNHWWTFIGEVEREEVEILKQTAVQSLRADILDACAAVPDANTLLDALESNGSFGALSVPSGNLLLRKTTLAVVARLPGAEDLAHDYQRYVTGKGDHLEALAASLVTTART